MGIFIVGFNGANATDSFNFKTKITGQTAANNNNGNIAGRVDVEIMVPLKYLSNFWRTLEMPLTNCEVELILRGLQTVLQFTQMLQIKFLHLQ